MGRHTRQEKTPAARPNSAAAPGLWRRLIAAALAIAALATAAGVVLLWPRGETAEHLSPEFSTTFSLNHEQVTGTVTYLDQQLCQSPQTGTVFDNPPRLPAVPETGDCSRAIVELTSGDNAGRSTQLVHWGVAGEPVLAVGDAIVLAESGSGASATYTFADYQRSTALWVWAALIAMAIVAFAAWRGVRAIIGLAYSLAVIFQFLLPAVIMGRSPLAVAIVACAAIIMVAVPLVHGLNWKSASALAGSLVALGLAALLAHSAISSTALQGLSSDDNLKVLLYLPDAPILGVLLCGFVLGALGGLNDVAIAQASTVTELAELDPSSSPTRLFLGAMSVGRDHIASMVYTLVLSYTGAALPLLMLISAAQRPAGQLLSSDLVATELLRAGVGALALTLAVPLTTLIATVTVRRQPQAH